MDDLVTRLRLGAADPMWANYAEVSKSVLRQAADRITAQAAEIEKCKAENEWLCAALKAYRDRKRRP